MTFYPSLNIQSVVRFFECSYFVFDGGLAAGHFHLVPHSSIDLSDLMGKDYDILTL